MTERSEMSKKAEELLDKKFESITKGNIYIAGFTTANKMQLALNPVSHKTIFLWTEPVMNQVSESMKSSHKRSYSKNETRSTALNTKNCSKLTKENAADYWEFKSLKEFEEFLDWYQIVSGVKHGTQAIELKTFSKLTESSVNSKAERKIRLANASKKPETRIVTAVEFIRNPDVVAEVLERANGICEKCHNKAPFLRKSDNSPYLEVHHKIRLADDGDDTVENAIALCPNCHREAHYG